MHLDWISQNDRAKLEAWDEFIINSPRGHYCQLSAWLNSYCRYGFHFDVLVARSEPSGPIVSGAGVLYLDSQVFRLATIPICPIVEIGYEDTAGLILETVVKYAREIGATLLQLHFPVSTECDLPALLPANKLPQLPASRAGVAFGNGSATNEMLWVDIPQGLDDAAWRERMFSRFSQSHKRYIRQAEKNGPEVFEVVNETDLREAYSMIEQNSRLQGYPIRGWDEFGETLIEQVKSGHAVVLLARHEGRNVGSHYSLLAGKRYSYVFGGVIEDGRDLRAGYSLHWAALNKARELGLDGYDLAAKTSPGVLQFKMGFRPQHIPFVEPQYFVFSGLRYKAFSWAYPRLRKHRGLVTKILRSRAG